MKQMIMSIILNLLLGLIGFFLIVNPQTGIDIVRFYLGIVLVIASLVPFWVFFQNRLERIWSRFIQGVLLALLGVMFLVSSRWSAFAFAFALVIWMVSSGVMKIIIALEYRKIFHQTWWYMFIFGIVMLSFGVYTIFNLEQSLLFLVKIAGVFMLVEAVLGIIDTLLYKRQRGKSSDVIDM